MFCGVGEETCVEHAICARSAPVCPHQKVGNFSELPIRLRNQFGSPLGFDYILTFPQQVGTAVVTRHDGRLALGRLGALCEQVAILIQTFIMFYQLV